MSSKESCVDINVDPSRQDPDTNISDRYGLYVDGIPLRLLALGRVYEGSSIIHHVRLANDMVNVGVEEV